MGFALAAVGLCAIVFAVLTVSQRNLYSSALSLMAVLLQVAAVFFLLGARLLGFLQALVYAGAVMVLIVIAVMSIPPHLKSRWAELHLPGWLVGTVILIPLVELGGFVRLAGSPEFGWLSVTPELETRMAALLFGRYALMTEGIGVLILISALGLLWER